MLLKLFKLNKRINSTKLPTNEDLLISGEVTLKGATSVDKPVFVMACGAEHMPYARICNYAEFQGNFFWITELLQISNTHIQVTCKIDVLATFRTEILATKAYVMYSASNGSTDIVDTRILPLASNFEQSNSVSMSNLFNDTTDTIVCITNDASSDLVTPYYLTGAETQYLAKELYAPDFLEVMKQYFTNPLENIVSAKLTPINRGELTNLENIKVGNYELSAKGHRFSSREVIEKVYEVNIPWNYTDFRNRSPYTQITLFLPFVGYVSLDNSMLYDSERITVQAFVEVITGSVVYNVYCDYPKGSDALAKIGNYSGNCNSDIPIARITNYNPVQAATSTAMLVTSIATKNPFAGIASAGNLMDSFQQKTQINGSLSSAIGYIAGRSIIVQVWSSKTNVEPVQYKDIIGLPYGSTVVLGNLSGFVQTNGVSVQAIAMQEELNEINNMLDRGVYIE